MGEEKPVGVVCSLHHERELAEEEGGREQDRQREQVVVEHHPELCRRAAVRHCLGKCIVCPTTFVAKTLPFLAGQCNAMQCNAMQSASEQPRPRSQQQQLRTRQPRALSQEPSGSAPPAEQHARTHARRHAGTQAPGALDSFMVLVFFAIDSTYIAVERQFATIHA